MTQKTVIPTESVEQQWLFAWAELQRNAHPELALLYAIPNGGKRARTTAARLKKEGVKKGVPDTFLPVPRGKYHGLFIELKRLEGGRVEDSQRQWIYALTDQGYAAVVCKGWEAAAGVILDYLRLRRETEEPAEWKIVDDPAVYGTHTGTVCPWCGYSMNNGYFFEAYTFKHCPECGKPTREPEGARE